MPVIMAIQITQMINPQPLKNRSVNQSISAATLRWKRRAKAASGCGGAGQQQGSAPLVVARRCQCESRQHDRQRQVAILAVGASATGSRAPVAALAGEPQQQSAKGQRQSRRHRHQCHWKRSRVDPAPAAARTAGAAIRPGPSGAWWVNRPHLAPDTKAPPRPSRAAMAGAPPGTGQPDARRDPSLKGRSLAAANPRNPGPQCESCGWQRSPCDSWANPRQAIRPARLHRPSPAHSPPGCASPPKANATGWAPAARPDGTRRTRLPSA